jgi:hypothetical protein
MVDRKLLDPRDGVFNPAAAAAGAPKESRVGLESCFFVTTVTSCGSATTMFLSWPNRKLSLTTSSVYFLILYGSAWFSWTFRKSHVMTYGPTLRSAKVSHFNEYLVTMVVSVSFKPVLNFAGVNDIFCPPVKVSHATCWGLPVSSTTKESIAGRRGWGGGT